MEQNQKMKALTFVDAEGMLLSKLQICQIKSKSFYIDSHNV